MEPKRDIVVNTMKIIKASKKQHHGNNVFHVEILYPGIPLDSDDTGFYTIGRIDHANFNPPGLVPMHSHRNDEILSYMRSGSMIHKDSSGNKEYLTDTHMMLMNAGHGIQHEESAEKDVEMLQIFMRPSVNGLEPLVQFHQFEDLYSEDQWRLVAGNAKNAPLKLRTETDIFDARLTKGSSLQVPVSEVPAIHLLYCFNGTITVEGETLRKGDSLVFSDEEIEINALEMSDLVLFQIAEDAKYSDTGMFSGNQYK